MIVTILSAVQTINKLFKKIYLLVSCSLFFDRMLHYELAELPSKLILYIDIFLLKIRVGRRYLFGTLNVNISELTTYSVCRRSWQRIFYGCKNIINKNRFMYE